MSGAIYWIDDKSEMFPSEAVRDRIAAKCNSELVLIDAKPETTARIHNERRAGADHELIVLDYWLGNLSRPEGEERRIEFGSSWAAILRADHPSLPIVGVTSETINDIPDSHKSQFLQLLERKNIWDERHDSDLRALIIGFPAVYELWKKRRKEPMGPSGIPEKVSVELQAIIQLLSPPEAIAGYLESALPEIAKQPWDQETPHEFSRWVIDILLGRPGFLFDSLEAATFVGLTQEGFDLVAARFDKAKYSGVFASDDRPRWWANQMRPVFTEIIGTPITGPVREHRAKLIEVLDVLEARFQSKAYTLEDGEDIPDCVAFDEGSRQMERRVQARIQDTEIDPQENPPPGFEARRIWRGVDTPAD